jgi:enolase
MSQHSIVAIRAREVLGGIPEPTIEVEVTTGGGATGIASVPRGASRGAHEVVDLRDGGARYGGQGVRQAIEQVHTLVAPALVGMDACAQRRIDATLRELDGTANLARLGGNAVLAVSMATAKAAAASVGVPLYRYIGGVNAHVVTAPMINLMHGGRFAPNALDFEDHLLTPVKFETAAQAVQACVEVYHALGRDLEARYGPVPFCGATYAPPVKDTTEALDAILAAVDRCGYAGRFEIGIDVAASLFYDEATGRYKLHGGEVDRAGLLEIYARLAERYPMLGYLEDPFHEEDFEGFRAIRDRLGIAIIGDDLYVSTAERLGRGIEAGAGNGVLLKVNQVGTLTAALDTAQLAGRHGFEVAVSVRSGETLDHWSVDVAIGVGARRMKLGAPSRGERNAKYNRLLRIEEELGPDAMYPYRIS